LSADRRLDVEGLQVVAQVAVNVLVVVARRQVAELPAEALAASVVLAGRTPAIPTPVAKRLHDTLQPATLSEHGATLAHGEVVRGIKALGCQVAKGASLLIPIQCS